MTIQIDPEGTEIKYLRRYAELGAASGKRVLEIGSGDGRLTWRYAGSVGRAVGIDLHPDDLRLALLDRPAKLAERVQFVRADAGRLPFRPETFDLAIFAWSF